MVKDNPKRFPDFFSININSERMVIPQSFLDCLNGDMSEYATLRNYLGVCWRVGVEKTEEGTVFRRGWKSLLKDNSIQEGEFLVFQYNNGHLFDFKVFGHSMCQKMGPPSRDRGKEPVEDKDEEHQRDVGDTQEEEDAAADDNEGGGADEEEDDDNYDEDEDDDDDDDEEEEDNDIGDVLLNNPFFVALYRAGAKLRVPIKVIKDNNLKLAKDMLYQYPDGSEWPGKVSVWHDGSTWIGGWGLFCRKNNFRKCDKCICELVLDRGRHRCTGFGCAHTCAKIKMRIIRGRAT